MLDGMLRGQTVTGNHGQVLTNWLKPREVPDQSPVAALPQSFPMGNRVSAGLFGYIRPRPPDRVIFFQISQKVGCPTARIGAG